MDAGAEQLQRSSDLSEPSLPSQSADAGEHTEPLQEEPGEDPVEALVPAFKRRKLVAERCAEIRRRDAVVRQAHTQAWARHVRIEATRQSYVCLPQATCAPLLLFIHRTVSWCFAVGMPGA